MTLVLGLGLTWEHPADPLEDVARRVAAPMALVGAFSGCTCVLSAPTWRRGSGRPARPTAGRCRDGAGCAALLVWPVTPVCLADVPTWPSTGCARRSVSEPAVTLRLAPSWRASGSQRRGAGDDLAWLRTNPGRPPPPALWSAIGVRALGFTGTSVWICPARKVAVTLLTNRVHPTRERVEGIRALRPLLHDTIWSWFDHR